jgi:predicted kinase
MSAWFPRVPRPPTWRIDWLAIQAELACFGPLAGCPQDPLHHAEGDVWMHTRLAAEALAASAAFRARTAEERAIVFVATLLHDIAKPDCTREEGGRVTAHGHARRGAIRARTLLWQMGAPFAAREQVAALIRWHQVPFFLVDEPDSRARAIRVSQTARCDLLALLAEADARGRVCADQQRLLDSVALSAEYCAEQGCLTRPYPFPSDHARFLYFRRADRDPQYAAFDTTRCEAVLLCGLPGAGKDTWLGANLPDWPVVSLDALRAQLGIGADEPQGQVGQHAREQARGYLRQGQRFAWNATHISRELRERSIQLLADYDARVRIVYLEVPEERLLRQNRERAAPVPYGTIERMLACWEVPDLTEAHQVDLIVTP